MTVPFDHEIDHDDDDDNDDDYDDDDDDDDVNDNDDDDNDYDADEYNDEGNKSTTARLGANNHGKGRHNPVYLQTPFRLRGSRGPSLR